MTYLPLKFDIEYSNKDGVFHRYCYIEQYKILNKPDLDKISDEEFRMEMIFSNWCKKVKHKAKRHISKWEAFDVFKESLYTVCIDKMGSGEQTQHFKDLLWEYKNQGKSDLDIPRAKQYPIEQLVRECGFEPRMNKINCPFHDDPGASCHIYRNTNTFHCFGCQAGSDTIDFAMKIRGCDFKDAVRQLT